MTSSHMGKAEVTKLMFLIPSLNRGGAERQLVELVKAIDRSRFTVVVVTFYDGGDLRSELEHLEGIHLCSLRKTGPRDVRFFWRLWLLSREIQPDIIIGYLNLPSVLCLLIGRALGVPVIWSLRASQVDFAQYSRAMRTSFRLGATLSRFADAIIVNSHAGQRHHRMNGYHAARMIVVPNGIDTRHFCPLPEAGRQFRARFGLGRNDVVIGLVGRLDGMKDHATFLRAAAQLAPDYPDVRFLCVGGGSDSYAAELRELGSNLGLGDRLIWAGAQNDMVGVYNAVDLLTSSSSGEGFSNVVAEAMSCGVPCVVTDAGDSALIVGETGIVVSIRDPAALSQAWRAWLSMDSAERARHREEARSRIEREFDLQAMVARTQAVMQDLLSRRDQYRSPATDCSL